MPMITVDARLPSPGRKENIVERIMPPKTAEVIFVATPAITDFTETVNNSV